MYITRSECKTANCLTDFRNIACLPVLTDIITTLVLVETGKEVLIRQSKEDVSSSLHQDLLDDVHSSERQADLRFGRRYLIRTSARFLMNKAS